MTETLAFCELPCYEIEKSMARIKRTMLFYKNYGTTFSDSLERRHREILGLWDIIHKNNDEFTVYTALSMLEELDAV